MLVHQRQIRKGATDVTLHVLLRNSSASPYAGLTGLAWNSGSLVAYYWRTGAAAPVAITLATQTVNGAHADGGFVEVDGTNFPGLYRLDLPDAVCAAGVEQVSVVLRGAANLEETVIQVSLVSKGFPKNVAVSGFEFPMRDSSTRNPATGKTVSCYRSIDGAAEAACNTPTATETANGKYKVDLAASDMNGDLILFRATASGCADTLILIHTEI